MELNFSNDICIFYDIFVCFSHFSLNWYHTAYYIIGRFVLYSSLSVYTLFLRIIAYANTHKHKNKNTEEILMEFRVFASMFIIGGILIIFGPPMGWNVCGFLLIELSVACILCMCFISTYWVMKKTYFVGLDSVNGPIDVQLPSSAPPLSVALADSKVTTEFIRHLVNEVSVENIFFLSDIMAYKRTFVDTQKLSSMGNGFQCGVATNLARLIYRRTFTHYAWAIAKTYVDGSSSLYVTAISDDVRERICDSLEAKDPSIELSEDEKESTDILQELHCVFDDAANEVYDQLKKSYARFGYSEQFEKVKKKFGGNKMLLIPNQTA